MELKEILVKYLPILKWGKTYDRQTLLTDVMAALIVTVMLIPQSLAYAQLAGLPSEIGLYASIAPLVLYAMFGTSRVLAVGPVAVVSLMTAAAISPLASEGSPEYISAAIVLALLSGLMLLVLGLLRLGFLANFLSHPVISGFITASGLQIAASQVGPLLGIRSHGETFLEIIVSLRHVMQNINPPTAVIGISALVFLFWVRIRLAILLVRLGVSEKTAGLLTKLGPVLAVVASIAVVALTGLDQKGVRIVGEIPTGLPALAWPAFDSLTWSSLFAPALLISIVGYVESISVAQTLASKKRQRIDPDQELIALGASNVGAAVTGGFPVTGGFARSVVNYDAGAETPAAGAFTAVGIALATLVLTPWLYYLPNATLAATILVAVLSMLEIRAIAHTWHYSKADAFAMIATIAVTLVKGVETGLIVGTGLSIFVHLYRTSRPHVAIVGQVPGTQAFRNEKRHKVITDPDILSMRIDESLYFPNARYMENMVNEAVAGHPKLKHLILMCPGINSIDFSALESLQAINKRLKESGVAFHLSEVKGPVMDQLEKSDLVKELTGKIFLTHYDAVDTLRQQLQNEPNS